MNIFDREEKDEKEVKQELPKSKANGKAIVANFRRDKQGNIVELTLNVNGNGQRIKYNEKLHKDVKIGDEINI